MMKVYLKKAAAVAAAGVLAISLAACGQGGTTESKAESKAESTAEESKAAESTAESSAAESLPAEESVEPAIGGGMVGGWTLVEGDTSPEANEDAKAAFEKAVGAAGGFTYEPAALLATQVVAGTNYCFMARKCDVTPDAQPTVVMVYVYADLSGGAEIISEKELVGEVIPGSFSTNAGDLALDANEDVKAAYDKAVEGLLGVNYEPVAYLAKQIVSGSNYMVLCRTTVVSPEAVPEFSLVTIYEDLQGNAKFGESEPLEIGLK